MKKRKSLFLVLLLSLVLAVSAFALACDKEPKNPTHVTEGPETGTYYSDSVANTESLFTMNSGNRFTLTVGTSAKAGTYVLDNQTLNLTFDIHNAGDTAETLSAEYQNGTISMRYNNVEMTFLKLVNYTVTFDTQGGSIIASKPVRNGRTIEVPSNPKKDGYVFLNWYSGTNPSESFDFATKVTANITLKANWAARVVGQNEFSVSFDLNYPTGVTPVESNPDDIETVGGKVYGAYAPTPASVTGYTFGGWWVSHFNAGDKLTYKLSDNIVFGESVTLFAVWTANSAKKAPQVEIIDGVASWAHVTTNSEWVLTTAAGTAVEDMSGTISTRTIDLTELDAGEYILKVKAKGSTSADDSDYTVRYFKVNTLARVSLFDVIGNTLVFNAVPNATNYSVLISCGNTAHNHTEYIPLGSDNYYDFSTCNMTREGITFTVKAEATGYLTSFGTYTVTRLLNAVKGHKFENGVLSWTSVLGALNYTVTVKNKAGTQLGTITTRGNFVDLSAYEKGELTAIVVPSTSGYFSPTVNTEFAFTKTTLGAVKNIRITNVDGSSFIEWDRVLGAAGYIVTIETKEDDAATIDGGENTSFELSDITWMENGEDYTVTIIAIGETAAENATVASTITISITIPETLSYAENTVSWGFVIGAASATVSVNGGVATPVADGANSAAVTLTQAGDNTITVSWYDVNEELIGSVDRIVSAFTVAVVDGATTNHFFAAGDKFTLPTATAQLGYTLNVWVDGASNSHNKGATVTITGDATFTANVIAKDNAIAYDYSVEEDFDTTGADTTDTVTHNAGFTLYVPGAVVESKVVTGETTTIIAKTFIGWYTQKTDGDRVTNELGQSLANWTFTDAATTTLYARWVRTLHLEATGDTAQWIVSKATGYSTAVTTLVLPNTVDGRSLEIINYEAFSGWTSLKAIHLSASVATISTGAFNGTTALETMTVDAANTNYTAIDGVLYSKDTTVLAYFPTAKATSFTVPSHVRRIGESAFYANTKLQGIEIHDNVTAIGDNAFHSASNLATIAFPAELTSIGDSAFVGTKITTIDLPSKLQTIGKFAFSGLSIVTLELPESLKSIDTNAFENCYTLSGVNGVLTIPGNVEEIGGTAFRLCRGITSVVFAGDLDTLADGEESKYTAVVIGSSAFAWTSGGGGAMNINSVVFNRPVKSIGTQAFYDCGTLSTLVLPEGLLIVEEGAFQFAGISALTLPDSLTTIGKLAFADNSIAGTLVIPNGVTTIDIQAFMNNRITSVVFGDSLVGYTASWFSGNTLTSVTLGKSSRDIAALFAPNQYPQFFDTLDYEKSDYLFKSTDGKTLYGYIETIGGPYKTIYSTNPTLDDIASLATIAANEFKNREFGKDVVKDTAGNIISQTKVDLVLASELTSIGANAFDGASGIRYIIFQGSPSGNIGASAFANTDVEGIYIDSLEKLGAGMFQNCTSLLGSLTRTVVGETATYAQAAKPTLNISSAAAIPANAFNGCTSLTRLVLGNSVSSIGASAFANTPTLTGTETKTVGDITYDEVLVLPSSLADPTTSSYATGVSAFDGSGLKQVVISSAITLNASLFANTPRLEYLDLGPATKIVSAQTTGIIVGSALPYIYFGANLPAAIDQTTFNHMQYAIQGSSGLISFDIDAKHTFYHNNFFVEDSIMYKKGTGTNVTLFKYLGGRPGTTYTILDKVTHDGTEYTITGLEPYAFAYNDKLQTVTLGSTTPTVLPAYAFFNSSIMAVPTGVTGLDTHAFDGAAITSIPALSGTIGTYAFANLPFTGTLHIPAGTYGSNAFDGGKFTEVTTDETGVVLSGEKHFINCNSLETITLNVTHLPNYALGATASLTTLNIPKLRTFGNRVLVHAASSGIASNLTSLVLPHTLNPMNAFTDTTFTGSNITTLTAAAKGDNTTFIEYVENVLYHTNGTNGEKTLMRYGGASTASITQTSYSVPSDVTGIGNYAFMSNTNITSITANSVNRLGVYVFNGCTNLQSATFGDITELTERIFYNCAKLATLKTNGETGNKLPNVATIGEYALYNCTALTSIEFNDITSIAAHGVRNCSNLVDFKYTSISGSIGASAFQGCAKLTTSLEFTGDEIDIGASAFNGCALLTSITFDGTVTSIGATAFSGCAKLTSLEFTGDEMTIGTSAFNGLSTLTSLTFDGTVASIGNTAFQNCSKLTTLAFTGEGITIGTSAFNGCADLESLTFDGSVTSIGATAFQNCSQLTSLAFTNNSTKTATTVLASAFNGCSKLEKVEFKGTAKIELNGATIFNGCAKLNEITFEGQVTKVANNAFNSFRPDAGADATVTFKSNATPTGLTDKTDWHSGWKGSGATATFTFNG